MEWFKRKTEPPDIDGEEPYLLTEEQLVSEVQALVENRIVVPAPVPVPPMPPMPPRAVQLREVKVVSVPAGGYGVIEGNALVAVALDADGVGRALTTLLT